jgi:O-antigen/teichoic acid export membrane protein
MKAEEIKRRVAISTLAQIAAQLLMGLLGVVILRVMTNRLGVESYGTYVTIVTFVTTLSLLTDLGLNTITSREVAKYPDEATKVLSYNMGLRLFLCTIMIPVISGLGFVLYPHASNDFRLGLLLMSCYLFFDSIMAVSGTYYASKIRNDVSAIIAAIFQLSFLLLVILVAVVGWGLYGYLTAYVLSAAVGSIVFLSVVRKQIAIRPRFNIHEWRRSLSMSITIGAISIASMLYLKADSIMISIITGTTAVGIYGVAYLLVNIFSTVSGYIMGGLIPAMAKAGDKELGQIIQKAFHIMVLFGFLLAVGGFTIRNDIVAVVSNRAFLKAAVPFSILALATSFSYVKSVFNFASIAINKQNKLFYISLGSLLLNIGINFFAIPHYGIIGAAWATVITEIIGALLGYWLFYKQTAIVLNLRMIPRLFLAATLSFLICLWLCKYIRTPNALLNCITEGATISGLYFTIAYAIDALPTEFREIVDRHLNTQR